MKKKFITLGIAFLMLFSLAACNTDFDLEDYKTVAKAEIANYATEDNYCADNWSIVCGIIDAGKQAVDAAENKIGVDTAVSEAKDAIDAVEDLEMENFKLTVTANKTIAKMGDKIIVTMQLENLSDSDYAVEIPDWIADAGGNELKDILFAVFFPINSGFDWEVNDISVEPRPRVSFDRGQVIEKSFEYLVNNPNDLEMFSGAFFYIGEVEESRFNQQIIIKKNPIKIRIEG